MDTFKLIGTGGEPHAQDNAVSFQAGKDDYVILPAIPNFSSKAFGTFNQP